MWTLHPHRVLQNPRCARGFATLQLHGADLRALWNSGNVHTSEKDNTIQTEWNFEPSWVFDMILSLRFIKPNQNKTNAFLYSFCFLISHYVVSRAGYLLTGRWHTSLGDFPTLNEHTSSHLHEHGKYWNDYQVCGVRDTWSTLLSASSCDGAGDCAFLDFYCIFWHLKTLSPLTQKHLQHQTIKSGMEM